MFNTKIFKYEDGNGDIVVIKKYYFLGIVYKKLYLTSGSGFSSERWDKKHKATHFNSMSHLDNVIKGAERHENRNKRFKNDKRNRNKLKFIKEIKL
jgi:uncharacterized protein YfiM (DUF2279 family)